jgi:hypothetical protein
MLRPAPLVAAALLGLAAGAAHAAAPHPNLSGFWEPGNNPRRQDAAPELTDVAQAFAKRPSKMTDPQGVDASDTNCLPLPQPWILQQSAPIDIVQDDRETTMIYEGRSLPFHIFTDGRKHPAFYVPANNGHSIGWWEGEVFVVDSIGFADHPGHGPLNNEPANPTLHFVQRFQMSADGKELHAHVRMEDPQLLVKPYEYDFTWHRSAPGTYAAAEVCDARDPANGKY